MAHLLLQAILIVGAAIGLALVAGVFLGIYKAVSLYVHRFTVHQLNKKGGQSYVVLSGSPEVVQQMYDICIRVAKNVSDQSKNEGIPVNDTTEADQA